MKRWLDDVRRDAIRKLREDKGGRKKLEDAVDGIMEFYDIRRERGLPALEEAVEEETVKWWSGDEESLAASVNKVIDTIGVLGERGEFAL